MSRINPTHQPSLGSSLQSVPIDNPSEGMPIEDAVASLLARVNAARHLREHHVWEAVRILPDTATLDQDLRHSQTFRALMEKDALREAVTSIARAFCPERHFHMLGQLQDQWVCMLHWETPTGRSIVRAAHADPAAAILAALLRSLAAGDNSATPTAQHEKGHIHG